MSYLRTALIYLLFAFTISAQNYRLVWSDEFDGTSINSSNWTHETGWNNGWGNHELEYYTARPENSFIENGKLVIVAKKENYSGKNYTSARMKTQGKFSFKYGKIEALMKLPYGKGMWRAFWMLGDNISSVGWPKGGELDIMEMLGVGANDRKVYGTADWDNHGQQASAGGNKSLTFGKFADGFNIFAVTWDATTIRWYLNGYNYYTLDTSPSGLSAFRKKFFIILNVAVGGDWPGNPDGSTVFPQRMEVDYVRVYQDAGKVPSISLNIAEDSLFVTPYSNIDLSLSASDPDGSVSKVEIFQGDAVLKTLTSAPYNYSWQNLYQVCYSLRAKVTDNSGNTISSKSVFVKVGDACVQAPYLGSAVTVPGTIEAENYDLGGSGVAYSDKESANYGGDYRTMEGVDIEASNEHGYNVGWTNAGEWMEYTFNVKDRGIHSIISRVAAQSAGGKFHLEIDGVDVTGSLTVPETGGWQKFADLQKSGVFIMEGDHVLRFVVENSGFNLNYFTINLDLATGVDDNLAIPAELELDQNYPNPFNPNTQISFMLPVESHISLKVFNALGEEVAELVNDVRHEGRYYADFNAAGLPSGIYIAVLKYGATRLSSKMILMK